MTLVIPAVASALPTVNEPPWPWITQTVDAGGVNGYTSLILDENQAPHIIYHAGGNPPGVFHAWHDGIQWSLERPIPENTGTPSGASDSQGRLHFTSQLAWDLDLLYTRQVEAGWVTETVDATGNVGVFSKLRLNDSDAPYIVYNDQTRNIMKLAHKNETGWQIEDIPGSVATAYLSLDLDSTGHPHVVWKNPGVPLKHSTKTESSWMTTDIDSASLGEFLALRIDSQDHLHVSYQGASETLKYAHYNGTAWTTEIVDPDSPTGGYTSIDVDSQDRPHIAYWQIFNRDNINDPTRGHLKYATKLVDGSWHTTFVDVVGITGWDTSIAVDDHDRPRISYLFGGHQPQICQNGICLLMDLKYAEPVGTTLLAEV